MMTVASRSGCAASPLYFVQRFSTAEAAILGQALSGTMRLIGGRHRPAFPVSTASTSTPSADVGALHVYLRFNFSPLSPRGAVGHCLRMKPSLTDSLCTRCGLCCDGSLFADVELAGPTEAAGLEVMGLEIEEDDADGGLLVQPCGALQGKRCGIYAHRPECCRTFECGLLQDVRRGEVNVAQATEIIVAALERVARVRKLVTALGQRDGRLPLKERYAEALALADEGVATPALNRKRAGLVTEMAAVEELIWRRFLGGKVSRSKS